MVRLNFWNNHYSGGFPSYPAGFCYSTTTGFDGLGSENYFFSSPSNCKLPNSFIKLLTWLIL
jgi:hypothetical protein